MNQFPVQSASEEGFRNSDELLAQSCPLNIQNKEGAKSHFRIASCLTHRHTLARTHARTYTQIKRFCNLPPTLSAAKQGSFCCAVCNHGFCFILGLANKSRKQLCHPVWVDMTSTPQSCISCIQICPLTHLPLHFPGAMPFAISVTILLAALAFIYVRSKKGLCETTTHKHPGWMVALLAALQVSFFLFFLSPPTAAINSPLDPVVTYATDSPQYNQSFLSAGALSCSEPCNLLCEYSVDSESLLLTPAGCFPQFISCMSRLWKRLFSSEKPTEVAASKMTKIKHLKSYKKFLIWIIIGC